LVFFILGAIAYKMKLIQTVYIRIRSFFSKQEELQKVTFPEKGFKNNFDWASYAYGPAYENIEKYLYRIINNSNQEIGPEKISKDELLIQIKGNIIKDKQQKVKIVSKNVIKDSESYIIEKSNLNYGFNSDLDFDAIFAYHKSGQPSRNQTIIILNGFTSSPEKMLGLQEPDYSNSIGKTFLDKGYDVIAPFMFNHGERLSNLGGLLSLSGTTLEWFEVNKVFSIIDLISDTNKFNSKSIGIYGISGGGKIAIYAAAIDDRIKSVVASGIVQDQLSSLADYASRKGRHKRKDYQMRFHNYAPKAPFYQKYTFSSISQLILPRPMQIECGKEDSILFYYGIENQCKEIENLYLEKGCKNNFSFLVYSGGHEAYPQGSLNWFINNL